MSSNNREDICSSNSASIKKAHVLHWQQSPLTERYSENLLISILILDSQPGIQALLSYSFVIEPPARRKIPVSASVQSRHVQANQTSRPRSLSSPAPLRMARDFPKFNSFYITFPSTFSKRQKQKAFLSVFHFPFLEDYITTIAHILALKHHGTVVSEIVSQVSMCHICNLH